MVKTLNIVPQKCTGCMQCELACSWVQTGAFQPSRSLIRVNVFDEEASYAPYACPFGTVFTTPHTDTAVKCNLCGGEPACATTCPTDAIVYEPVEQPAHWFDEWAQQVESNHLSAMQDGSGGGT